jgi:hypothetical protein
MMARITKLSKGCEVWAVIPMKGEKLREKKIMREGMEWDLNSYERPPESTKSEQGQLGWSMGVKKESPECEDMGELDAKTISTITTSVSYSSGGVNRGGDTGGAEMNSGMEVGSRGYDLLEVMKKDREELRNELELRLAKDRAELKEMMREMMKGLLEAGQRK